MQFLQGLKWGEMINREISKFVEEWIFDGIEEGFLSAALHRCFPFGDSGASIRIQVIIFQRTQYCCGSFRDSFGDSCDTCHMNSITASGSTGDDAVEEYDIVIVFANGNVPVGGLFECGGEICEFVVVGGEHGSATSFIVEEFGDGPCKGNPIVGAGTASDFIEDYEAAWCGGIQDAGGFGHFHHECALSACQFIARPNSREDSVGQTNSGRLCRNEGADLGHDGDECCLPNVSALAGHIWAGDDLNKTRAGVGIAIGRDSQSDVVGDELSCGQESVEDRVSAITDIKDGRVFEGGSAVAAVGSDSSKAGECINFGEGFGGPQKLAHGVGDFFAECVEKVLFEGVSTVFGAEDFVFVFLKFRGDEAFLVFERLFADVFGGNFFNVGGSDFEVVAEDFVEANFEAV
ncbi:MAG: hypothetical protein RLZZ458_2553, partial [Planctomycetota bacterium]